MSGSFALGANETGASPYGLFTVTSARYCSRPDPRSVVVPADSTCGWVSMNEVVIVPAAKSGSASTCWRKPTLVATPRIRNSASARRAFCTAFSNVAPRQVSLASIESKCGLTSAPL
jgi:hypothetical protein